MSKIALYTIILNFLLLQSLYARADWGINGIAAECSESEGVFELSPIVELSSPAAGEVRLKQGFRRLNKERNELYCHIGQHLIKASIRAYGSDGGACMGAGYVSIDRLTVGRSPIIEHSTAFNWDCPGEQILVGLRIIKKGTKVYIESCSAKSWHWDKGFQAISCTSKELKQ